MVSGLALSLPLAALAAGFTIVDQNSPVTVSVDLAGGCGGFHQIAMFSSGHQYFSPTIPNTDSSNVVMNIPAGETITGGSILFSNAGLINDYGEVYDFCQDPILVIPNIIHAFTVGGSVNTTYPEAKISANTSGNDLLIRGVDTYPTTVTENSAGNFTITDSTGLSTTLVFQKTYTGKYLTYAKLVSIQYGSAAPVTLPSSYFLYIWNPLNKTLLSQTIYANKTFFIEALFDNRANQTTVYLHQNGSTGNAQKFTGLEVPALTTSLGTVGYSL